MNGFGLALLIFLLLMRYQNGRFGHTAADSGKCGAV